MREEFAGVAPMLAEYAEVEAQMSDPAVLSDAKAAKRVGRRYAELGRLVHAYRAWDSAAQDLADAKELAAEI